MNRTDALEYIHKIKWRGSRLGLGRTKELLAYMGNPEKKLKFVHIAGTNGKGSTAACIAAVLREAGYIVGLYTSPYINCFNERMQVNGEMISDEELSEITEEVRPFADSMEDGPTEFELITVVAMLFFLRRKCDIVVLETGLGGALDSTNVIPVPEVAVITAIGMDHVKELGGTLEQVASAKAGIIKHQGRVVIYGGVPEADAVFSETCRKMNAKLTSVDFSDLTVENIGLDGCVFSYHGMKKLSIPLCGEYQPKNAALAVTALEALREKGYRISEENIRLGLSAVRWPGRFEVLGRSPVFILDGGHNVHGLRATVNSLKALFNEKKIIFVVGVMADKDVEGMAKILSPAAECAYAVSPDNPRAMTADSLALLLGAAGIKSYACDTVREGVLNALRAAGQDGVVCALGSLYFSGDVRKAYEETSKLL